VINADLVVGKGVIQEANMLLVPMNSIPTDANPIYEKDFSMELLYTASVYTACS